MADIKISQLASVTSLSPSDLFAISKSLGGGNWESKSITADSVLNSIGATRLLKVAKDGVRDADTIEDALIQAAALTPTEFNPVAIQVFPGSYYENNSLNIPEWVSLYSEGGSYSAAVIANNDGDIFIGNGNSVLDGFTIVGGAAYSNVAYYSSSPALSVVKNLIIINCHTGILSDNSSIETDYVVGLSFNRVFEKFINSINAGFIVATSCNITKVLTSPVKAFCAEGSGSEVYCFSCNISDSVNGLYSNDDGYIDALSCHMETCDNAIVIGSTGSSSIKAMGCIIEYSNEHDIQVLSSTARLSFSGHFDSYTRQIVSGATVTIVADDEGTNGTKFEGESNVEGAFSIGYPGAIFEEKDIIFNVGDGRSYYSDRYGDTVAEYWSWNNTTSSFLPYTNYTGTQLAGNGDAIIVGSKYPFSAIRLEIVSVSNVGSNTIDVEYWNGSTWVETTMCAYDRETLTRLKNEPFTSIGDHYDEISQTVLESVGQVDGWDSAYDVTNKIPAWSVGYPLYALRFKNNGALITGMTFRNAKIRGDGYQVSTESAKQVRWGKFRSKKVQYIDSQTFIDDAVYPPTRTDLIMSSHLSYKDMPNFRVNAISEISTAFIIPSDLDTASPLSCSFDCVALSANSGAIATSVYIIRVDSTATSIITGSMPETEYTQLTNVAGIANSFATVTQDLDVSDYGTNDLVLIGFRRKGTDPLDTYDGDALVGDLILNYYSKFS